MRHGRLWCRLFHRPIRTSNWRPFGEKYFSFGCGPLQDYMEDMTCKYGHTWTVLW